MTQIFRNELIHETSPYLQQHAHNPVNWLPWGDKALNKAKSENKPIFLSIGYSACHWCHVMEHESFMDESVADLLNAFFIPIKVDREERPDVDHIYMTALQSMTEHAGWPLSMFLTPNAEPFYGGTYFPKNDSQGMPGFTNVLKVIAKTWENDAENIMKQSRQLTQHLKSELNRVMPVQNVDRDFVKLSLQKLESYKDAVNGGFYSAPKFPQAFCLDLYVEGISLVPDADEFKNTLALSLRKMAEGGIYDHLEGGFHRYSTDSEWLVPHFEKMLYDNAALAKVYFDASLLVDEAFNLRIGNEVCKYVLREMTHKDGAFFSSTDADTEGVEGKHFVWTRTELKKILGEKDGELFAKFYSISKDDYDAFDLQRGTPPHEWFHGHVLHCEDRFESLLASCKTTEEHIQSLALKVYEYRKSARTKPFRDEKILTSWNAMMIQALVKGYIRSGNKTYADAAKKAVDFLLKNCVHKDHSVLATWKDGKAQHKGTFEDYASLGAALIAVHQAVGEHVYLEHAKHICDKAIELFWDDKEASFYYTAEDSELIVRAKNLFDQALPSAHSVMGTNLFFLARIFVNPFYQDLLDRMLVNLSGFINKMPHALASLVKLASYNVREGKDYVLIKASPELRFKVLKSLSATDIILTEKDAVLDLVRDKTKVQEATLFVCYKHVCDAPVSGQEQIEHVLVS